MIAQLRGLPTAVHDGTVVLDVHGVGYHVHATTGVVAAAAAGASAAEELTVHTYLNVREDALQLFGFTSLAERELFLRLLSLQGVGPKVALAIVSAIPAGDLRRAVAAADVALLQSIPGIGPKVARRIVTELSGKLDDLPATTALGATVEDAPGSSEYYEAREALVGLGLTVGDAEAALRTTDAEASVEDRIRQALQAVRT